MNVGGRFTDSVSFFGSFFILVFVQILVSTLRTASAMKRNSFSMFASVLLIVAIASAIILAVSCNAVSVVSDNSIVFFVSFCILVFILYLFAAVSRDRRQNRIFRPIVSNKLQNFFKIRRIP